MIYGLYLSAQGILANSKRQDVIANNLANSETTGFKRDLTYFVEQRAESAKGGNRDASNPLFDPIGGGLGGTPTYVDHTQGDIETSSTPTDLAIHGEGYFAVQAKGEVRLTRDGRFSVDSEGYLSTAVGKHRVLDNQLKPISLSAGRIEVTRDGRIMQEGGPAGRVGLFDVPKRNSLAKTGGNLLTYPDIASSLRPATGEIQGGALEHSNADPTTELTALMDAQRQLEANANMIRYQDQTLGRLVNDVGRIG
jgi:flagellar basal body rod protein FlgG